MKQKIIRWFNGLRLDYYKRKADQMQQDTKLQHHVVKIGYHFHILNKYNIDAYNRCHSRKLTYVELQRIAIYSTPLRYSSINNKNLKK